MLRGCFLFGLFLLRQFRNLRKPGKHMLISLPSVGNGAVGAVFYACFRVPEISAAVFAQGIQRAITKQAVEFPVILNLVAGKIGAFPILKKGVIILHVFPSL